MNISGTLIWYYFVCKREVWLMSRELTPDQDNSFIEIGRMIEENFYKRVNKVLKIGRKYLSWIQNSVLEGEITKAKFEKLKFELRKVIDENKDSIIFYVLRTTLYSEREIIGRTKGGSKLII